MFVLAPNLRILFVSPRASLDICIAMLKPDLCNCFNNFSLLNSRIIFDGGCSHVVVNILEEWKFSYYWRVLLKGDCKNTWSTWEMLLRLVNNSFYNALDIIFVACLSGFSPICSFFSLIKYTAAFRTLTTNNNHVCWC